MKKKYIFLLLFTWLGQPVFSSFKFSSSNATIDVTGTNSVFDVQAAITDFNGVLKLKDNVAGTITGSTITFNDGFLQTGNVISHLTGTFDPTSTDLISLDTNDVLDVASGTIVQTVAVANDANAATILGQPLFSSAIALGNASSKLNLGITTQLNQNITGSGTVTLLNDLTLASGIQLPTIVDLNGKKLHITGGTISSAWGDVNTTGGVIELGSNLTLSAAITLGQSGATNYTISGNGNTLDLGTGSIEIGNASSNLRFSNLVIKGLTGVDAAAKLRGAGTITFSDCTLVLAGNYQRNDGDFIFSGDPCKVITNGSTFIVDQAGVNLDVDGIVLEYEQLDLSETSPFLATNSATITESNGGLIKSTNYGSSGSANLVVDATSYTFTNNFFLTSSANIEFNNDTVTSDKDIAVDGNGHAIYFPKQSGTYITVDENIDLTLSDIVLKDFNHKNITLAPATTGSAATLSFGDDCLIEMNQDLTIASGDAAWSFTGNATVNGFNNTLKIEKASGLTIADAKTVTLKNLKIVTTVVDGLKCLGNDSHLKLQNCQLILQDAGFDFDTGHLDVEGIVVLEGANLNDQDRTEFLFSTSGNLTIGENAILKVEPYVNFKYDTAANNQILFSYPSSTIHFNGCGIESGDNGIGFFTGSVIFENKVDIVTSTLAGGEVILKNDSQFLFLSGSRLQTNGVISYQAPVPIKQDDSFVLRSKNYNFYYGIVGGTGNNQSGGLPTIEPNTTLTIEAGSAGQNILTYPAAYAIKRASSSGGVIRAESGVNPPLSPAGVYRGTKNEFPGSATRGWSFFKTNHSAVTTTGYSHLEGTYNVASPGILTPHNEEIFDGDEVAMISNGGPSSSIHYTGCWLVITSEIYIPGGNHELCTYNENGLSDTLSAPPSNGDHIFIIEKI